MRLSLSFLLFYFLFSNAMAQVPSGINFQGLLRNSNGNPVKNKSIVIRSTIIDSGAITRVNYAEHQQVNTNSQGLYTLIIGQTKKNEFSSIDWSKGVKRLRIEIDTGTSFSFETKLVSVPYAYHAKTVELENQKLVLSGDTLLSITPGNSTINLKPILGKSPMWNLKNNTIVSQNNDFNLAIGTDTVAPGLKLAVEGKVKIGSLEENNSLTRVLVADADGIIGFKNEQAITPNIWLQENYGINYGQGKVTIGSPSFTNTANAWLHIKQNGIANDRNLLLLENTSNNRDAAVIQNLLAGTEGNLSSMEIAAYAKNNANSQYVGYGVVKSEKVALVGIGSNTNVESHIAFYTGGDMSSNPNGSAERMRIDKYGNIGIGTAEPKVRFHITDGDVYIENINGFIMKGANGSCYRIQIDENGILASTPLPSCP